MDFLWKFLFCTLLAIASAQDDCSVQNLELVQEENLLSVIWSVAADAANCDFTIAFSSNAESQSSETISVSGVTQYDFTNRVPCSDVTIGVTPVGGSTVSASTVIETSVSEAPILRDMITSCNSIEMIWDAQSYEENMCQVTHFQLFCLSDTHNFTIPQAVTDVQHRTFDIFITVLRPDIYYTCNGYIFVTLGGFSPASDNIEFWSNLDMVRDLQLTETADSLRATWEAPLNSEECGVAYDVTFENEVLGSQTVEVVGLSHDFDIPLISCTDYTITVSPISYTGSKGTAVSKQITPSVRVGDISEINALDDSEGNAVILSWSRADVGLCEVSYIVEHLVNGEVYQSAQITGVQIEFERIPCAVSTFRVEAVSGDVTGNIAAVDLELTASDITWIGEVTNVRLEGELVAWEPPVSVGLCSISYRVLIENNLGSSEQIISDTSADFSLVPCSSNSVEITGVSGEVVGQSVGVEIVAPDAELSPPLHIRTIPNFTTASITLEADSNEVNQCEVGTVEVQCSDLSGTITLRSIPVQDDESRIYTVELENLALNTIYNCEAAWKNSDAGNEFSFRTIPLVANSLSASEIGENSFLVSWTEEYGRQFVSGYVLDVVSIAPLNSVRKDCEVETNVLRSYTLDGSDQSLEFGEGLPNYEYSVTLRTTYTLGVEVTSETLSVQTATGVPGLPDNLQYTVGDYGGYNVSAYLNWLPPCDLNGDLTGFTARVIGNFEFGGVEQSVEYSVAITGEGDLANSDFAYEVNNLNPLFTYEVLLATEAAVQGDNARLTIVPPEACLC